MKTHKFSYSLSDVTIHHLSVYKIRALLCSTRYLITKFDKTATTLTIQGQGCNIEMN